MSSTLVYSVPEMSCDHCVAAINDAVGPLDGVESVAVDLDAKTVTVVGGDRAAIETAIDDAGYDLTLR